MSGGMYNLISKGVPCGVDVEVQETPCSGVGMTPVDGRLTFVSVINRPPRCCVPRLATIAHGLGFTFSPLTMK